MNTFVPSRQQKEIISAFCNAAEKKDYQAMRDAIALHGTDLLHETRQQMLWGNIAHANAADNAIDAKDLEMLKIIENAAPGQRKFCMSDNVEHILWQKAIVHGTPDIMRYLKEIGYKPENSLGMLYYALGTAFMEDNNPASEINDNINALLDMGFEFQKKVVFNECSNFEFALQFNNVSIVKKMVEIAGDEILDRHGPSGMKPLAYSINTNAPDTTAYLMQSSVSIVNLDTEGHNAIQLAEENLKVVMTDPSPTDELIVNAKRIFETVVQQGYNRKIKNVSAVDKNDIPAVTITTGMRRKMQ